MIGVGELAFFDKEIQSMTRERGKGKGRVMSGGAMTRERGKRKGDSS